MLYMNMEHNIIALQFWGTMHICTLFMEYPCYCDAYWL